ncbi:histidine N-acetyltransferase-like [Haliotis cracherodii]|uniref:histidine N-acetyltransferase-like n=1 Tax=Haliotis cracherodii TaxID=6455 RepID=UPI0039ECBB83
MIRNALQRFAANLKYSHNRHFCTRSSEVKVTFRKATINDYEGVMKINENVHRGRDYLPEGFHSTVTDPNLSAHLGEVDNRIMTFGCARLLDGGRTLLFTGGRTHASYRGQGHMAQLLHHIKSGYSSNKNILYEMFETEYGHPMLSHPYAQGSSMVLERPIHCFPFRVNDLHLNQLPLNDIQFSIPTQTDLERLLSDKQTHGYLFPGDRIVVNRIPFRAHPQNVPQMTTADVCFHTGDSQHECLSFGKSHSCKLGLAYNIDIYGDHPVGLTAHVYKHLQEIAHIVQMRRVHDKGEDGSHRETQDEVDERVHLLIFASVSVDMSEVYEALRTLGINRVEWPVKAQVVIERDFRVE